MNKGSRWIVPAGVVLLFAAFILAIGWGSVSIPIRDVLDILKTGFLKLLGLPAGMDAAKDQPAYLATIVLRIRLPRALAAAMVGGALAVGGTACQGVFRNPLSEPYLLGVSSGAALGATLAFIFFPAGPGAGLGPVGLAAFIGALGVSALVFFLGGRNAFRAPAVLLLSGIAVAFLCQALIWLLMTLNRDQVERITFWTLGSLSGATWNKLGWLAGVTLPVSVILIQLGRTLDVLSIGYKNAHGLGVKPGLTAGLILALTALSTAAAVAVSGSIGFVGLLVPHVMRMLGGPSHQTLLIRSWIGGAVLLVGADFAARVVNSPGEIPVGVITAILGAPFLLWLARRHHGKGIPNG